ncbi:hypothetical protein LB528_13705 [Mesorhizobium sp. CA4]|nr:hypothetical protein [Mesorhizobium sp. CA4]
MSTIKVAENVSASGDGDGVRTDRSHPVACTSRQFRIARGNADDADRHQENGPERDPVRGFGFHEGRDRERNHDEPGRDKQIDDRAEHAERKKGQMPRAVKYGHHASDDDGAKQAGEKP